MNFQLPRTSKELTDKKASSNESDPVIELLNNLPETEKLKVLDYLQSLMQHESNKRQ